MPAFCDSSEMFALVAVLFSGFGAVTSARGGCEVTFARASGEATSGRFVSELFLLLFSVAPLSFGVRFCATLVLAS